MKTLELKQAKLQSEIQRFNFQLQRWKQIKGLLKAFRNEHFEAPKGFQANAEKALIHILSIRQKIRSQRKKYDIDFLREKMEKYVALEQYEKAVPFRDRLNYLNQFNK